MKKSYIEVLFESRPQEKCDTDVLCETIRRDVDRIVGDKITDVLYYIPILLKKHDIRLIAINNKRLKRIKIKYFSLGWTIAIIGTIIGLLI